MSEADRGVCPSWRANVRNYAIRAQENQYRFADDLKAAGQIMADAKRRDGQSRSNERAAPADL